MKRGPANSAASAVRAMQNATRGAIRPPAHVKLREGDLPFWEAVVRSRARDEWTPADLVVAAQLSRCQADIEREQATLDVEGSVIDNAGRPMLNPRSAVADMLARREMAQLHRHMRSLRRALVHSERTVANFPAGLTPVIARLAYLDQDFEVMESRARFFHDEIDAKLASETNRQLYILSVLTAAFLPPTLVAGLFGMNLGGLPWSGSPWGFCIALGLCLLSSAAVWLFLWNVSRRQWK